MATLKYTALDADAQRYLESNTADLQSYLDFLAVVQDVMAEHNPHAERSVFPRESQEERMEALIDQLPGEFKIRDSAMANRELALLLASRPAPRDARRFVNDFLTEYRDLTVRLIPGGHVPA